MSRGRPDYDHLVKLLLIGDSGVGKSCLLMRFSDDSFTTNFITTIGIDFKMKNVTLDGKKIKLQVWDTAGQERFRTITNAYYRGAMGILMVFDVSDRETFASVRNWMSNIQMYASQDVNKILVGNKCDIDASKRRVTTAEGEELAAEFGIPYMETSAMKNINVEAAFMKIATDVKERLALSADKGSKSVSSTLDMNKDKSKSSGSNSCC